MKTATKWTLEVKAPWLADWTESSQHKSEALAEKMGRRLAKMTAGRIEWRVRAPA